MFSLQYGETACRILNYRGNQIVSYVILMGNKTVQLQSLYEQNI